MLVKDEAEKKRRGYTDPKSFVRNDGSEVLYRKDWRNRKRELVGRSQGRCERISILDKLHHIECSGFGSEPHHIIPRSKGRDDRLSNLAALSHACHSAEDPRKIGGRHASKD